MYIMDIYMYLSTVIMQGFLSKGTLGIKGNSYNIYLQTWASTSCWCLCHTIHRAGNRGSGSRHLTKFNCLCSFIHCHGRCCGWFLWVSFLLWDGQLRQLQVVCISFKKVIECVDEFWKPWTLVMIFIPAGHHNFIAICKAKYIGNHSTFIKTDSQLSPYSNYIACKFSWGQKLWWTTNGAQ